MRDLRATEQRFRLGDSITTPEMEALYTWYGNLIAQLELMFNPGYDLMLRDARWQWHQLDGYLKSRRERA